jgi:hypothetical protein
MKRTCGMSVRGLIGWWWEWRSGGGPKRKSLHRGHREHRENKENGETQSEQRFRREEGRGVAGIRRGAGRLRGLRRGPERRFELSLQR